MRTIDPGHWYELDHLGEVGWRPLVFCKRVGERYPGNEPPAYSGTNCQEVLRALINRATYLNSQIPCAETEVAVNLMTAALLLFEVRAKRVKGRSLDLDGTDALLNASACAECGHAGMRACGHVLCVEAHPEPAA